MIDIALNTMVSKSIFRCYYCIGWYVKESHLKVSRFWRLFRKFLFPPKQCCFSHVIHALPGKQLELPPIEHGAGLVLGVGFHWNIRCFAGHLCSHRCTCALAFGSCSAERTGRKHDIWDPNQKNAPRKHLFFLSFAGVAAKNLGRCISCQMLMANFKSNQIVVWCIHMYTTPRKINMELETTPLEEENHLPNHHFQVLC